MLSYSSFNNLSLSLPAVFFFLLIVSSIAVTSVEAIDIQLSGLHLSYPFAPMRVDLPGANVPPPSVSFRVGSPRYWSPDVMFYCESSTYTDEVTSQITYYDKMECWTIMARKKGNANLHFSVITPTPRLVRRVRNLSSDIEMGEEIPLRLRLFFSDKNTGAELATKEVIIPTSDLLKSEDTRFRTLVFYDRFFPEIFWRARLPAVKGKN